MMPEKMIQVRASWLVDTLKGASMDNTSKSNLETSGRARSSI